MGEGFLSVRTCGQPKINNVMRNLTLNPGETARYLFVKILSLQQETERQKGRKTEVINTERQIQKNTKIQKNTHEGQEQNV